MPRDKTFVKIRSRDRLPDADQARRQVGSINPVARTANSATWHLIMTSDTKTRQRRSKSFLANAPLVDERKRHSMKRTTQKNTMERGVVARYINTHARQRLAKRLRAHVNHGSLKHDPDRARVSKNLNEKERRYLLLILLRRDKDPRDDYYGEEEKRIFIKGIFKF